MKQGDYTRLADYYAARAGYAGSVLSAISTQLNRDDDPVRVADIGAGTGKLAECLCGLVDQIVCVEPNDDMRRVGMVCLSSNSVNVEWRKGFAENTGLSAESVSWVLMGSSFHWTNQPEALREFHRLLKSGGLLTVVWNPRDIGQDEREKNIECYIRDTVPELVRVSSGSRFGICEMESQLLSGGLFVDPLYAEAPHQVIMDKFRYLNVWRSVNDVQSQAGPERFEKIMSYIEKQVEDDASIVMKYRTRAWTVRKSS